MRLVISLLGWIAFILLLQSAAWILDFFLYLPVGRVLAVALKLGYLAFGVVILVRFLSLKERKPLESLLESLAHFYPDPTGHVKAWEPLRSNPLYFFGLIAASAAAILCSFSTSPLALRTSILMDSLIGFLVLHWVIRTFRLRFQARKERLKAILDDARSKVKPVSTASLEWIPSRKMGILVSGISLISGMTLGGMGLTRVISTRKIIDLNELKVDMDRCRTAMLDRFYAGESLSDRRPVEACLQKYQAILDPKTFWEAGQIGLQVTERADTDFFGDGKTGNQGLQMVGDGRFRWAGTGSGE